MRSRRLATEQASHRKVDLFCLNGFESYNKFTLRKMIDICCVRSGIKYHSLSYWSIVITSLVELFLSVQKRFRKDFSFRMVHLMKRIFWPQTEKLELPQYKSPSLALTAEG